MSFWKPRKSKFWNEKKGLVILSQCVPQMKIIWCMVPEIWSTTQNFFSFWTIFCPFTPLTPQKIKILKKWKKRLKISSFYSCVPKIIIICVNVREIWRVTNVIFIFHFGLFFAFLAPYQPKNLNFKGKKRLKMSSFCSYVPKLLDDARFLRCGERQTDGQTDGRKDIINGKRYSHLLQTPPAQITPSHFYMKVLTPPILWIFKSQFPL